MKDRWRTDGVVKFCANCGAPLVMKELFQRPRACCLRCQQVYYEQLKVGAGVVIEQGGRILLLRRTKEPFANCWNLPAGYVEVDESPVQAAVREAQEEAGLHVEATGLAGVYFFNDDPRGNGILIVYDCMVTNGTMTESDEASSPTFFACADVPSNLAGGGHDQAICAWKELRG